MLCHNRTVVGFHIIFKIPISTAQGDALRGLNFVRLVMEARIGGWIWRMNQRFPPMETPTFL
jgi:hypothetical protein